MSKSQTPIFEDYQAFYAKSVAPLKTKHPDYIRLDGKTEGSNRKAFAYFKYQDQLWKIDADTYVEKLDIAWLMVKETNEPFIIRPTRDGKSKCLTIVGEPLTPKRFYVYQTTRKKPKVDTLDGINSTKRPF